MRDAEPSGFDDSIVLVGETKTPASRAFAEAATWIQVRDADE